MSSAVRSKGGIPGESCIFQCPGKRRDYMFMQVDVVVEVVGAHGGVVSKVDIWP